MSTDAHSDDEAVDAFAVTMKQKLARAREAGRAGWQTCSQRDLSSRLHEHVVKGEPVDVANFCMFLDALGLPIGTQENTEAEKWKSKYEFHAKQETELRIRLESAHMNSLRYVWWTAMIATGNVELLQATFAAFNTKPPTTKAEIDAAIDAASGLHE